MMNRNLTLAVIAGALLIGASCGSNRPSLVIWPGNAIKRKTSDYTLSSPAKQLDALRQSEPERDAKSSFARGDDRFVGERRTFPVFDGVPYDALLNSTTDKYGFKVIAFSDDLLTNKEFNVLRTDYQRRYNKTLYNLLAGKGVTR